MKNVADIKFHFERVWVSVLAFVFVLWFGAEAFQVENGLPALRKLQQQERLYQQQSQDVQQQLYKLQNNVQLMDVESVDPDMLEEQVRQRLGFVTADDVLILRDE